MPTASLAPASNAVMTVGTNPAEIPIISVSFTSKAPYDSASHMATGRRIWKPIMVTKEWGTSSPQLLKAAVANESIDDITIEFIDSWVRFNDVQIVNLKQTSSQGKFIEAIVFEFESAESGKGAAGRPLLSEFQISQALKIPSGIPAQDDWTL